MSKPRESNQIVYFVPLFMFGLTCIYSGRTEAQNLIGTAFTYQGRLEKPAGTPLDALCTFRVGLWTDANSTLPADQIGSNEVLPVDVQDGNFTAVVDFLTQTTDGTARWLQVEVQCPGDAGFQMLTPRLELKPVPHAFALPGFYTQETGGAVNIFGGHHHNHVIEGVVGATISGGGGDATLGANSHWISDNYGTIAGGLANTVGGSSLDPSDQQYATVCGGVGNNAYGAGSTIGGGENNWAYGIGSMIPGGSENFAGGWFSLAAGHKASVRDSGLVGGGDFDGDEGTFVWADRSVDMPFQSTGPNQFLIRSVGGVGINTNAPTDPLTVNGVIRSMTGGFKFPDGSVMTTAVTSDGGPTYDESQIALQRWDRINITVNVGDGPSGLAIDGSNVWVANELSDNVTKVRAEDGVILGTYPVGDGPTSLMFDGTHIWVANTAGNSVTQLLASNGANLNTYPITGPNALAFDGSNIWVATSQGLSKRHASDWAILGTFELFANVADVVFDGDNVWASRNLGIQKRRVSDNADLGLFSMGGTPGSLTYDGEHIVAINDSAFLKLRASDGTTLISLPYAGIDPHSAFDGASIWVADGTLVRLRALDATAITSYQDCNSSDVLFDGAHLWYACFDDDTVVRLLPGNDAGPNFWAGGLQNVDYYGERVGIGGSALATLDVQRGATPSINKTAAFATPTAGPELTVIHAGATGDCWINSASTSGEVLLQQNGGLVGIGTGDPNDPLHIRNSSFDSIMTLEGTGNGGFISWYPSGMAGGRKATTGYVQPGDTYFTVATDTGNIVLSPGGAPAGNVGIGVNAPVNKLDVEGRAAIGATYAGTLTAPSNGLIVEGNVGVATASPLEKLHVNAPGGGGIHLSSNNVGDLRISFNNGGGTHYIFDDQSDSNSLAVETGLGNDFVVSTNGANNRMRITSAGLIGMGRTPVTNRLEVEGAASKTTAGDWLANSDACIKKDVRTITNALSIINRLRPVAFRYTDEYKSQHPFVEDQDYYNFIAQEFAEVFPEAVSEDGSGILQMDSHPASIYAVAAIQELNAIVKEKDIEIQKLARTNAALAARLARIEAKLSDSTANSNERGE